MVSRASVPLILPLDEQPTSDLDSGPPSGSVLVIEDNASDAEILAHLLCQSDGAPEVRHARSLGEGIQWLQREVHQAIFLDLHLPDGGGLEAVREVTAAAPSVPVIVLTGAADPKLELEAVKAGAQDFLRKSTLDELGLLRSMSFAVERKRSETRLAFLAHHDALTGLANRTLFDSRLRRALERGGRSGQPVALLFLDLDRFKQINDTLGHEVGDQLLVQVAERLRGAVRAFETVARLGGDEFVVVLENLDEARSAEAVAKRILATMEDPFSLGGARRRVSTSVGVAVSRPNESVEALMERADGAMYRAKRAGRSTYAISDESPVPPITFDELERAIREQALGLVYQPRVDLSSRRVVGAEALLRWHHPRRGEIGPSELFPILEPSGLLVPVGDWVLAQACQQARRWAGPGRTRVAVNIAKEQLGREGLASTVEDALSQSGLQADCLELEVTEEAILADVAHSQEVLARLKSLGVKIALDDFSARSALTDLTEFPLDIIKLDRTLVSGIQESPARRAIAAGVINLSHNLGIETVAVGVESREEQRILRKLGCDAVQGYLVCGPMDPGGLTVWMANHEADLREDGRA